MSTAAGFFTRLPRAPAATSESLSPPRSISLVTSLNARSQAILMHKLDRSGSGSSFTVTSRPKAKATCPSNSPAPDLPLIDSLGFQNFDSVILFQFCYFVI
ncbi:hypothetical protein RchiOBHm_Chr4g0442731 [Rosa chinensis]|uniref:Uncharacterized protein n=1 Tax=Rosa chinensis TaxID=74649 RepID=A0A2P6R3M2_ROSCH|nr:uncharacterized protein LOC112197028 [Rosa chinensis]PRQ41047.1 hypothetical protein RchiOBHm_Chr4g0442731 [Rosa chinensis]